MPVTINESFLYADFTGTGTGECDCCPQQECTPADPPCPYCCATGTGSSESGGGPFEYLLSPFGTDLVLFGKDASGIFPDATLTWAIGDEKVMWHRAGLCSSVDNCCWGVVSQTNRPFFPQPNFSNFLLFYFDTVALCWVIDLFTPARNLIIGYSYRIQFRVTSEFDCCSLDQVVDVEVVDSSLETAPGTSTPPPAPYGYQLPYPTQFRIRSCGCDCEEVIVECECSCCDSAGGYYTSFDFSVAGITTTGCGDCTQLNGDWTAEFSSGGATCTWSTATPGVAFCTGAGPYWEISCISPGNYRLSSHVDGPIYESTDNICAEGGTFTLTGSGICTDYPATIEVTPSAGASFVPCP